MQFLRIITKRTTLSQFSNFKPSKKDIFKYTRQVNLEDDKIPLLQPDTKILAILNLYVCVCY